MCPEGSKEWVRLQCKILNTVPGNEERGERGEPVEGLKHPTGMVSQRSVLDDNLASYFTKEMEGMKWDLTRLWSQCHRASLSPFYTKVGMSLPSKASSSTGLWIHPRKDSSASGTVSLMIRPRIAILLLLPGLFLSVNSYALVSALKNASLLSTSPPVIIPVL